MANFSEMFRNSIPGSAVRPQEIDFAAEVDSFIASLEKQLKPADPILQRRDNAIEHLRRIGLVPREQIDTVREDLERALGFKCRILRVVRAVIASADGCERTVTRLIAGGYQQRSDEVVDPTVRVIDNWDGHQNNLSDETRARLWQLCANTENPVYIAAGAQDRFEGDIHEALVAVGRDQGMPVRDVYRLGGPAVSGVREPQSFVERTQYSLSA